MLRIPVAQPLAGSPPGNDFVILEDSVVMGDRRPPSSASHETLILPPDHEREGSTAIRLGQLAAMLPASALPAGISSTNKFTLVEELGRGGMGIILRGRDKVLHRDVALKVIRDPGDELQRQRFIKEAQVTGQLEHPNIVPVHEFGVDQNGRIFFAMKLVRGRTLAEIVDGHRRADAEVLRDFPLSRLVTILIQVCHAVAFAHSRGVIHRDLKPSNVMLGDFGEVMLMDWGLAKVGAVEVPEPAHIGDETPLTGVRPTVRSFDETQDGAVLGTPAYMPPEQALGQIGQLDARSDVYSLGAILYELLTLHPPVEGDGIKEVLQRVALGDITSPEERTPTRDIPRDLSAVAMKALALKPSQRYPDAAAMRGDLERFLDGRMVSAREDNLMEVLVRFIRRHRVASSVVGSATILLIGVAVFGYVANLAQRRVAESERHRAEELRQTADGERIKAEASGAAAERERERATMALHQAQEQRQFADEARARATLALESESRLRLRSEQAAHLTALSLAGEQISRRDYGAARTSLDHCPLPLRDWSWRRLALLCHRHLAQYNDHVRPISRLASGAQGRLVASAGEDGAVVVNDLRERRRLLEVEAQATAIALDQPGSVLAVAEAARVRLFALSDGHLIAELAVADTTALALPGDGTTVVIGTASGELIRWSPLSGGRRLAARLGAPISALHALDAGGIRAGDEHGGVIALNAADEVQWQRTLVGGVLALSPQGLALVRGRDQRVAIHDATSGVLLSTTASVAAVVAAGAFSDDGLRFALACDDRTARVFNSVDAAMVVTLEGHAGAVSQVAFLNGHTRLLSAAADGSVRLWDAELPAEVRQLAAPGTRRIGAYDTTGDHALLADQDGQVQGVTVATAALGWQVGIGFAVRVLHHPPSSSLVAVGGEHGQARILDLRTGALVGAHGLGTETLVAIVCDPAGSRLFALDDAGWLRGIDRATGRRYALQVQGAGAGALTLSPDGRQVICGGAGGKLTSVALDDATLAGSEATPLATISALAASADGKHLALAGGDQIVLLDARTRQTTTTLRGHVAAVTGISFNADGTRLISASLDGTVRVWDVASGRTLLVLEAHSGGVRSAHLTGDDRDLLTIGIDGRVLRWLALERRSWD